MGSMGLTVTPYKTLDPSDLVLRLGNGPAHRDLEFWSLYSLAFELRDLL